MSSALHRATRVIAAAALLGCGDDSAGAGDMATTVDWALAFDTSATEGTLSPALLGQYDLSGALMRYDQQAPLVDEMKGAGFAEWRVGVGRWEFGTRLLPTLTDGTSCAQALAGHPAAAAAPMGTTDLDLIQGRDWFTFTDGAPVTLADTADDARYRLDYLRAVLDVVDKFGAAPYVGIDHMPRALAAQKTPARADCGITWSNRVSNVCPADPAVFAAAVAGLVKRTVEGSDGKPGRPVRYWEFWNEPEGAYAWDPSVCPFTPDYFATAAYVLAALDGYRKQTANPDGQRIKIGLGSFASAQVAATVIASPDFPAPYDFVSFHVETDDDPLAVAAKIQMVADARKASKHPGAELLLTEWSAKLDGGTLDPETMDVALHHATVLVLGATAGLTHAHHALFWDFLAPGVPSLGLLRHDLTPKPAYYAWVLLAQVIRDGAARLAPIGHADGKLDGGLGAVLASRDAAGQVRVLLVNRATAARTATVGAPPTAVTVLDDPTRPPRTVAPSAVVTVPARSIVLIER